uniref:Uncharacterized protein n=1 Tax=Vitrella brassicaformis TaxID=1169539 RepID=A0A7S1PDC0_9ALVE|mmetsp:Transcript_50260/g.125934  ORF Transcript_50260/g.125934 Transcript_50260/m.125934 type:complete len:165 (+) Transcript_50260:190-684(+)
MHALQAYLALLFISSPLSSLAASPVPIYGLSSCLPTHGYHPSACHPSASAPSIHPFIQGCILSISTRSTASNPSVHHIQIHGIQSIRPSHPDTCVHTSSHLSRAPSSGSQTGAKGIMSTSQQQQHSIVSVNYTCLDRSLAHSAVSVFLSFCESVWGNAELMRSR